MEIKYISIILFLSTIFAIIIGKIFIPILKKRHIGQNIRDDGPKSHLAKQGTPTMGGIIIAITLIAGIIALSKFDLPLGIVLLCTFGFGAVGFIDDFMKLIMRRSLGLNAKQKIVLQVLISAIVVFLYKRYSLESFSYLKVPFIGKNIDIGAFIYILIPFVLIGTVNAVNLTDGLDGLVSSVTIPVLPFLLIVSAGVESVQGFVIVLMGSVLGFLVFNSNKASVFMGDTGSMTIGGAIAGLALVTNTVFFLPIFGLIYVIEAGSVIIQVISYKTRNKKRVFLMSPIHHHYELKGYNEQKIVTSFSIISLLAVLVAVMGYF
ncbi:MAG: phospho-N-acetylmuramoyl-pentapeptide-transferase [Tissierellia bacterium]|nr:phospho-N-acetylmuramoyl-pentapeptide-transferase [Tissierellia bacterium]